MTTTAARIAAPLRAAVPWYSRPGSAVAAVLTVIAVGFSIASLAVVTSGDGWGHTAAHELLVDASVGLGFATAGGLVVVASDTGRRMGWLLLAIGCAAAGAALAGACAVVAAQPSGWAIAAAALYSWLWVPGFVPIVTLLPLLYPDGRLPGPRWRPVAVASVLGMVALAAGTALYPETFSARSEIEKPVSHLQLAQVLVLTATVLLIPAAVASLASLVLRLRRSSGLVRRQIVVLLVTAGLVLLNIFVQPLLSWPWGAISQCIAVALVPVAIGVAVTRHRLYDLDLAVCRGMATISLAVCLAGIYLTLVSITRAALPADPMWSAALAAGVTGLLVHPLGVRLAKGVDRMFYGDRSDPALVLSRLLSGLRESLDIWEVPAAVCHGVVDSLRLGAATLSLGEQPDAPAIASVGDVSGPAQRLELRHRGETVGTLTVTPRPGERGLDTRDVELLRILADQVAPAIAALRLHESLQQSRAALVTAREEERRRLRRDLHDGIGAALAGIRLQLESARELVDDRTAGGLIDAAVGGVSDAVGDLRGITEDLRPPVLEDLGLEGAVVSLTERLSTPGRRVVVDMGELGELPAAVEVASYRIIAEALANAARHSGATDVAVGLVASGHVLKVVVSDNGCGLPQQIRPGALGLTSMRSRAEELGGELTVRSTGSGTEIAARLPWRMT